VAEYQGFSEQRERADDEFPFRIHRPEPEAQLLYAKPLACFCLTTSFLGADTLEGSSFSTRDLILPEALDTRGHAECLLAILS
jgi:hypothetical protein